MNVDDDDKMMIISDNDDDDDDDDDNDNNDDDEEEEEEEDNSSAATQKSARPPALSVMDLICRELAQRSNDLVTLATQKVAGQEEAERDLALIDPILVSRILSQCRNHYSIHRTCLAFDVDAHDRGQHMDALTRRRWREKDFRKLPIPIVLKFDFDCLFMDAGSHGEIFLMGKDGGLAVIVSPGQEAIFFNLGRTEAPFWTNHAHEFSIVSFSVIRAYNPSNPAHCDNIYFDTADRMAVRYTWNFATKLLIFQDANRIFYGRDDFRPRRFGVYRTRTTLSLPLPNDDDDGKKKQQQRQQEYDDDNDVWETVTVFRSNQQYLTVTSSFPTESQLTSRGAREFGSLLDCINFARDDGYTIGYLTARGDWIAWTVCRPDDKDSIAYTHTMERWKGDGRGRYAEILLPNSGNPSPVRIFPIESLHIVSPDILLMIRYDSRVAWHRMSPSIDTWKCADPTDDNPTVYPFDTNMYWHQLGAGFSSALVHIASSDDGSMLAVLCNSGMLYIFTVDHQTPMDNPFSLVRIIDIHVAFEKIVKQYSEYADNDEDVIIRLPLNEKHIQTMRAKVIFEDFSRTTSKMLHIDKDKLVCIDALTGYVMVWSFGPSFHMEQQIDNAFIVRVAN